MGRKMMGLGAKRRKKAFPSLHLNRGRWRAENTGGPVAPLPTRVTEGVGTEPTLRCRFLSAPDKNPQDRATRAYLLSAPKDTDIDKRLGGVRRNGEKHRRNGSDLGATPSVTRVGEVSHDLALHLRVPPPSTNREAYITPRFVPSPCFFFSTARFFGCTQLLIFNP